MTTRIVAILLACLTLAQAQTTVRLLWERTPDVLARKRVVVLLKSGTKIEGSWTAVTPDTFSFAVSKTSDSRAVAKGLQTLARSDIQTIRFGEKRVRARIAGGVIGYYGVLLLSVAATRAPDASQGAWGIASAAGAVAGFFTGRAIDRSTRELIIDPPLEAPFSKSAVQPTLQP